MLRKKKGGRYSLPSSRGGAVLKADPPDPVGMRYQAVNVVEIKKREAVIASLPVGVVRC
jgi:hypothetical protein